MARKQQPKPQEITTASGAVIPLGGLVSYYRNGWRLGHLEEITGKMVKIRPMKPAAHLVTVGIDDLKEPI